MRYLTRMGLGLAGLALVSLAPTTATADPPAAGPGAPGMTPPPPLSVLVPAEVPQPRPRRSKAMFQKPHLCPQCQWEEARAKGINAPPPPMLPQGAVTIPGNNCDRCGGAIASISGGLSVPNGTSLPVRQPGMAVAENCVNCEGNAPGRAVAGGEMAGNVPGYVVVGGTVPTAEPIPIGVVQGRYANPAAVPAPGRPDMPMPTATAMNGGRPGRKPRGAATADPAVMPTNFKSDPYLPNEHNRPHILRHLLGFDGIGQRGREERERRERENHASISYQGPSTTITDISAKSVYGK
jgi:hypothetical protein